MNYESYLQKLHLEFLNGMSNLHLIETCCVSAGLNLYSVLICL